MMCRSGGGGGGGGSVSALFLFSLSGDLIFPLRYWVSRGRTEAEKGKPTAAGTNRITESGKRQFKNSTDCSSGFAAIFIRPAQLAEAAPMSTVRERRQRNARLTKQYLCKTMLAQMLHSNLSGNKTLPSVHLVPRRESGIVKLLFCQWRCAAAEGTDLQPSCRCGG